MKILILHGPNLNLLGQREPEVYGTFTLEELNRRLARFIEELNERRVGRHERIEPYFYQSNHEGVLVDTIQGAPHNYAGIVYNPAAHTHYSIALRDAIASIPIPVVEVHLSNIGAREGFRSLSVMAEVCIAQFMGRGISSYQDGIELLIEHLDGLALPLVPLGRADGDATGREPGGATGREPGGATGREPGGATSGVVVEVDTAVRDIDFRSALEKLHD